MKGGVRLRKQGMSLGKTGFKKNKFNETCERAGEKEVELRFKDPARRSLTPLHTFIK